MDSIILSIDTKNRSINLSIKELETEINKAIKSENYERAAQLRDEISKRKNKK